MSLLPSTDKTGCTNGGRVGMGPPANSISPVHGPCPRVCPRPDSPFRREITRRLRQSTACPRVREDRDTKIDTAIEKPLCVFRTVDRYLFFFLVKKKRREREYGFAASFRAFPVNVYSLEWMSSSWTDGGQAADRPWTVSTCPRRKGRNRSPDPFCYDRC